MNSPKYQVVCQWCGAKSNKVTGFTVEKWMSRHDAKHESAILFTFDPAPTLAAHNPLDREDDA